MNIIGLCGNAGSGKDTVADFIVSIKYDLIVYKLALAGPMKKFCQEIFDFSDDQMYGPSEERNKPDKRYPRPCWECKGAKQVEVDVLDEVTRCPRSSHLEPCPTCNGEGVTYLTPRHALQQLGTEFGRACYENVWVDYALREANRLLREGRGDLVVITDVRFINEAKAIKAAGGQVWRIERPIEQSNHMSHASEQDQHTIEMDMLIDEEIINLGSLADLKVKVRSVLP